MYEKQTWKDGEVITAEKMNHAENGIEAANNNGVPIGTIISFMGLKAPSGYLICDGSTYKTDDLPDLAAFFKEQFDSEDYFGGSVDEGTFAVPDMRNLFVRGYHCEGAERLSRDVGYKQEGTGFPRVAVGQGVAFIVPGANSPPLNVDTESQDGITGRGVNATLTQIAGNIVPQTYTSRPVNMAVLFCIKATDAAWINPPDAVFGPPEIAVAQNNALDNLMFEDMTKSQLLAYAEQNGVKGVSGAMRKTEIIEAIEGARA